MSERGSFVTSYIYCEECMRVVRDLLLHRDKYLCSVQVPSWARQEKLLPIVAGKIGGLYVNEEIHEMERLLEGVHVCHEVNIAVLSEGGDCAIFDLTPAGYRLRWRG